MAFNRLLVFRGARLFFQFADGWLEFGQIFFGHAVDEEHAVKMVGLVLDATGEETVAVQCVRRAAWV